MSAEIEAAGVDMSIVCCFDPTVVLARLRKAFPELVVSPLDSSWKTYVGLAKIDAGATTLRIAENDAQRRGPIWTFELPLFDGTAIRGKAERYIVCFQSKEPIPESHRDRIIDFLHELQFASCVEVKSVELRDNDEFPA